MPSTRSPRKGSMQYWPRKRAKKIAVRIGSWTDSKEAKVLGFAGFKVGMTHATFLDNRPNSMTKGQEINKAVTILECPPLKPLSVRFYKKSIKGMQAISEIFAEKLNKEVGRRISIPKKKREFKAPEDFDDLTLLVYTQPQLTGLGAKKPQIFEMGIGGNKEDKLSFVKEQLGKDINITDVFEAGQFFDVHAVTKGKGFQGPVKRFGVGIRARKSEKTKRGPGSLGDWKHHALHTVAHAGQMGYHTRTEYNKKIMGIGDKPEDINQAGGFVRYGLVKNPYVIVKGSVAGPRKRLIRFNHSIRSKKGSVEAPEMTYISVRSKQ